jgi:hypothetical protein
MFAAEFEPADNEGRRRSARASVSLEAGLGAFGRGRTLCKVVDVSIHGARLQTYSALKKGSTIWLTLPSIGHVAAEVKWADDFAAGCQFQRPLDTEKFEQLLQVNGAVKR